LASTVAKVGLIGDFINKSVRSTFISCMIMMGVSDFINKSLRSTFISCMITMGVFDNVIQTITRHKNPKSLKRYDRTAIIRHLSAQ
jgi:hypothetical protein